MSYKPPLGDPNLLKKKIVSNPKYNAVGPTIDTGVNINVAREVKENSISVKQQPGELFKRIRPSSIAQQIEIALSDPNDELDDLEKTDEMMQYIIPKTQRRELLILDMREAEEFEKCHIQGAINYPAAMLSRSMNNFTAGILKFKNKENHFIILYDLEEDIVVHKKIANVFVERGVENTYIIAGGLREFVQDYSRLILGESPVPIVPRQESSRTASIRRAHATGATGKEFGDRTSVLATSVATSHKPRSLASSLARPDKTTGSWR